MKRDEFFWLSAINQATILINTELGLLPENVAKKAIRAVREVMDEGESNASLRPKTYITYEPRMLEKGGAEISLMHAGRSSQDMHATFRAAILRDEILEVSKALNQTMEILTDMAGKNVDTVVPNYTNGVPAQPNSYAHYLLGFREGFERDFDRIKEFFTRVDKCPMGSTVLNGTGWPLDREAMAKRLGFSCPAKNAFDATQVAQMDLPVEYASILSSIALHISAFLEDLMVQYAQSRPWILLQEGGENTYVSSAMPQKRNPGLINNCRTEASEVLGDTVGCYFRAHNLQTGMMDPKRQDINRDLGERTVTLLNMFNRVLKALVVNKQRALEELNSDWTSSQEIADVLMREYGVPFRVGHHVASKAVSFAKANGYTPLTFPYPELQRIYKEVIEQEYPSGNPSLPMSEKRFRQAIDPIGIVRSRKTSGGPQPEEIQKMLDEAKAENKSNQKWTQEKFSTIENALECLNKDFDLKLKKLDTEDS